MVEYIEREAVIKKLNEAPAYFDSGDIRYGIDIAMQEVIKQPTADVVKVVRCSKCKYQDDCAKQIVHTTRDYVLEQNVSTYNKVDFCSFGELKEREGK